MTAYTGTAGMHDTGRSQPRLCLHERIQQLQGPKNHAFQPEVQVHLTRLDCAQVCELRFILPDWTVRRCVSCGSFYQIGLCAGSCENRNMEGGKIFMKLLIDDAHMDLIRHLYEFYPVDGVTTNPSILAKSKRNPYEVLKEIRAWIGADAQLHVQAVSREAAGMEEEAHRIVKELGENTYVKIPALPEGFKAMKTLCKEGIFITATAVYTPMQAFLAGKCGASYAAPYINRIDNLGYDGVQVAKKIHDMFRNNGLKTEVLAASFKNSRQLLELCEYGVGAATVAPEIMEGLVKNQTVTAAVEDFIRDFESLTGTGINMSSCETTIE